MSQLYCLFGPTHKSSSLCVQDFSCVFTLIIGSSSFVTHRRHNATTMPPGRLLSIWQLGIAGKQPDRVNNQNLVVQHLHLLVDVWIASSQRSLEVCFQRITRLPTYTSDVLLKICQPPKATIRPKRWWLLQNWSSYFNSLNHSTNGLWKDRRSFSMSFEWLQRWLPWCGIFRNNFKIFTDLCLAIVIFLF